MTRIFERPTAVSGALVSVSLAGAASLVLGAWPVACAWLDQIAGAVNLAWRCTGAQSGSIRLMASAPIAVAATSLAAAAFAGTRYCQERRLVASLPLTPVRNGVLADLAAASGIPVYLAAANRSAAFCTGLFRPRIVFTTGLVARLSSDECEAAFWHEHHHATKRDPLRTLLSAAALRIFFWLPMLRGLVDRYVLLRELEADRSAANHTSVAALAGALQAVTQAPDFGMGVGLAECGCARVGRLVDPCAPLPPLFTRRHLVLSAAALASLITLGTACLSWLPLPL